MSLNVQFLADGLVGVVAGLVSAVVLASFAWWTRQEGHELSFGQSQKIAQSRGYMRDEPLLMVLDEPTTALDAETGKLTPGQSSPVVTMSSSGAVA